MGDWYKSGKIFRADVWKILNSDIYVSQCKASHCWVCIKSHWRQMTANCSDGRSRNSTLDMQRLINSQQKWIRKLAANKFNSQLLDGYFIVGTELNIASPEKTMKVTSGCDILAVWPAQWCVCVDKQPREQFAHWHSCLSTCVIAKDHYGAQQRTQTLNHP